MGLFEGYTGLTQWQAVVTVLCWHHPGRWGVRPLIPTVACQNCMAIGRICTCTVEALHWADPPVPDSQRRLLWAGSQLSWQVANQGFQPLTPLSPKFKRTTHSLLNIYMNPLLGASARYIRKSMKIIVFRTYLAIFTSNPM